MLRLLGVLLFTSLIVVASGLAQPPAPPPSCEDNLKIVIKHDQDLDQHRRQLEIRAASLATQLEDKDREIAKLKSDLAAAAKDKK